MSDRAGYRNHEHLAQYRRTGFERGHLDHSRGIERDACPYRDLPGYLLLRRYWFKGWESASKKEDAGT